MLQRRLKRLQRIHEQRKTEVDLITSTVVTHFACDEEEEPHRGSVIGRRVIPRDRYSGYVRLMNDYFVDNPVYPEYFFQRRCLNFRFPGLLHIFVYSCIHLFCFSGFI
jgi:hypothetical protein